MQGPSSYTNILVIPYGATTGQRIVINGSSGTITAYTAANTIAYIINSQGIFFYNSTPSLTLAIVGVTAHDPQLNILCLAGITSFTPGTPAQNINLGNSNSLSFSNPGMTSAAVIASSNPGILTIQTGQASGGDTQAVLFMESQAAQGINAIVNVQLTGGNLQVNGVNMTVP